MKKLIILIVCLASVISAHGQTSPPSTYNPQLITYQGIPFGVCSVYQIAENVTNGNYYTCNISTHLWQSVGASNITISSNQVGFGCGTNLICGSPNFLWNSPVTGALNLNTTSVDCTSADGSLLAFTNSQIALTGYIQKCPDGSFFFNNDGALSPNHGFMGLNCQGSTSNCDIDIRGGNGASQLYCNSVANVGVAMPSGSCRFTMFLNGVGNAKFELFAGSPINNDFWWDAGTGCSTWHTNNSLTKGATLCPPASSNNTTVVTGNTCGTVSANGACSNASPTNYHCASGSAVLSSGASTITGIAPAFSDTTFIVLTNDATTKTNASSGAAASGSSITFSGTGTDTLNFVACGG